MHVNEETPTFSIGDVAEETGITPETLRVWERRYGKPVPVRLPSGHRRYTGDQVVWLRNVAEALARGIRAGSAMQMDATELQAHLTDESVSSEAAAAIERVLALVADYRGEALGSHLAGLADGMEIIDFIEERMAPIVRAIGRAWAEGRISVRHEHYFTAIASGVLNGMRAGMPRTRRRPRIVLATLEGEWHGIGLQMAALSVAAQGVSPHVLGVSTPIDDIAGAVVELSADMLGVSVSLATGGVENDRALAELRAKLPADVQVFVGGAGARRGRRGPRGLTYVTTCRELSSALAP